MQTSSAWFRKQASRGRQQPCRHHNVQNERKEASSRTSGRKHRPERAEGSVAFAVHEDSDSRQRQYTDSVRVTRGREESTAVRRSCHAQHVAGIAFGGLGDYDACVPVPKQHVARGGVGARGLDAGVPVPRQHRHEERFMAPQVTQTGRSYRRVTRSRSAG